MHDVSLFGEDAGHETVLRAVLRRMSNQLGVPVRIESLSATGGITRVHHEFDVYLRDVERGKLRTPDMIVVATDGNCKGYTARRQEIAKVATAHNALSDLAVYAIPDPHIERWLLADPAAFQQVLGRGCNLPQHKCEKDFYKKLLAHEVQESGVRPIFGGMEYAEDIIEAMNFPTAQRNDSSIDRLLKDLTPRFNQWRQSQE